ncbi:hypothetical protein MVEN_01554500 [Mycena venus]|uniref:Uncharacterized protein n=1 Tax=Mycena venus TaxID=2733690 RepID=A0A8H6XS01_9AGAR|nr:hypothetical protein MVEN_01554500 [Mycena venus]
MPTPRSTRDWTLRQQDEPTHRNGRANNYEDPSESDSSRDYERALEQERLALLCEQLALEKKKFEFEKRCKIGDMALEQEHLMVEKERLELGRERLAFERENARVTHVLKMVKLGKLDLEEVDLDEDSRGISQWRWDGSNQFLVHHCDEKYFSWYQYDFAFLELQWSEDHLGKEAALRSFPTLATASKSIFFQSRRVAVYLAEYVKTAFNVYSNGTHKVSRAVQDGVSLDSIRLILDSDATRSSERTVVVERLAFAGGRVLETKRPEPSMPRSERSLAAVERLAFSGGRVLATKRSEPSLKRKTTVSSLSPVESVCEMKRESRRHGGEKNGTSGKHNGEPAAKPRHLDEYNMALENERTAVEMQIIALVDAVRELELERIALDRRRLEVDEEQARVNRLIASTRRNLRRINDELGTTRGACTDVKFKIFWYNFLKVVVTT